MPIAEAVWAANPGYDRLSMPRTDQVSILLNQTLYFIHKCQPTLNRVLSQMHMKNAQDGRADIHKLPVVRMESSRFFDWHQASSLAAYYCIFHNEIVIRHADNGNLSMWNPTRRLHSTLIHEYSHYIDCCLLKLRIDNSTLTEDDKELLKHSKDNTYTDFYFHRDQWKTLYREISRNYIRYLHSINSSTIVVRYLLQETYECQEALLASLSY